MLDLKNGFFGFWTKNYKFSFLVFFLLLLSGIFSAYTIPKESSPDIKFGMVSIVVSYPGVSPTDIDNLITEKIEKELQDVDGIKKITQTSSVGISSTSVELYNGIDVRDTITDIKDVVDKIDLPEDANDPIIQEISTMNELMFQALIYGDRKKFDDFTINTIAKKLQNALEGQKGIISIDVGGANNGRNFGGIGGGQNNYEIKVLISKEKMELLGLSINDIAGKIRAFNKNMPIGNYTIGDLNYDFRFEGEFTSIEELENVIIRDNGYSKIKLLDVAEFKKEYSKSSINSLGFYEKAGYNYISLSFNKKPGESIFKISKDAKIMLEGMLNGSPEYEGLKVKYSNDMSEIIKKDYNMLGQSGIMTIVLVFIIITIFVGLRESIITSILLPLAFLITFMLLDLLGLSMNFLTNFSLVLSLGIAIDTIIVIIEGADERQKLGYSRETSILLAIKDLKAPLISGTATTLVAFIPMIFLPGIVGKFLSYIPITVFFVLLAALLLSLTLSAPFFTKLAKKSRVYHSDPSYEERLSEEELEILNVEREGKKHQNLELSGFRLTTLAKLRNVYYMILKKFMNSKVLRISSIILPTFLLILTFIFISPKIGFTLFPSTDEGVLTMNIEAKTGTNKDALISQLSKVDEFVQKYEELKVFYTNISGNIINVSVELTDTSDRQKNGQRTVYEIEKLLTNDFQYFESLGFKVSVEALKGGPPTSSAVGIKLIASDNKQLGVLRNVAKDFEEYTKTLKGTKNVSISSSDNPGQFIFSFNNDKLSFLGLTPNDILGELYFYINGVKAGSIKSLYEDNDIVIKISDFDKKLTPLEISNLVISTKVGKIRVGDVAEYVFNPALSSITREDGNILISVNADLEKGFVPTSVQPKLAEYASSYVFPDGISYLEGGENAENADLIISTVKSFFIAIFLIFSILVLQFGSYSQSLMILYTVILALLGVNIGLFITGNPYSMPFAIGFIALTGVVVNDAIIFISTINNNLSRLLEHGDRNLSKSDFLESILMAGKSRLQPIIVTTLTTVIGILPLALQDEFWAGLGFTVIFGLVAGSFMTLFIIPSIYYSFYYKRYVK